jgi:hypothetical protein
MCASHALSPRTVRRSSPTGISENSSAGMPRGRLSPPRVSVPSSVSLPSCAFAIAPVKGPRTGRSFARGRGEDFDWRRTDERLAAVGSAHARPSDTHGHGCRDRRDAAAGGRRGDGISLGRRRGRPATVGHPWELGKRARHGRQRGRISVYSGGRGTVRQHVRQYPVCRGPQPCLHDGSNRHRHESYRSFPSPGRQLRVGGPGSTRVERRRVRSADRCGDDGRAGHAHPA